MISCVMEDGYAVASEVFTTDDLEGFSKEIDQKLWTSNAELTGQYGLPPGVSTEDIDRRVRREMWNLAAENSKGMLRVIDRAG